MCSRCSTSKSQQEEQHGLSCTPLEVYCSPFHHLWTLSEGVHYSQPVKACPMGRVLLAYTPSPPQPQPFLYLYRSAVTDTPQTLSWNNHVDTLVLFYCSYCVALIIIGVQLLCLKSGVVFVFTLLTVPRSERVTCIWIKRISVSCYNRITIYIYI